MTYGFEVYIDESGDEGFKFRKRPEPGSSEWFVLSAAIVLRSQAPDLIAMMRKVRQTFSRPPNYTLHFKDLNHDQRVAWLDAIAQGPIACTSVIVDKPAITKRSLFRQKDRLYFYATRLLLERVSWFCRDYHRRHPQGDGSARIIFSKRKGMRYEDMRGYLVTLQLQTPPGDDWLEFLKANIRIHWPSIKIDQIESHEHHAFAGLQVADGIASGIKIALEYSTYGQTEHRFAKMLRESTYHAPKWNGRNYLSYGLKFFPKTPGGAPRCHWIDKYYSR